MRHVLSVGDVPPSTPLLEGIGEQDLEKTLLLLHSRYITFDGGDLIRNSDSERRCAAYLVYGHADGYVYDEVGNRSILHLFMPGQMLSCGKVFGDQPMPSFDIVAREECGVLIFMTDSVPTSACKSRALADTVKNNVARSLAELNVELLATLDMRLRRTIRAKLLAYLNHERKRQGSKEFDIVYNRQELADYLCVDRSALSRELGNLRDEGLVRYTRNHFELL